MSVALDYPLPLHAPQHACFAAARLSALPHARILTSPAPTLHPSTCSPHAPIYRVSRHNNPSRALAFPRPHRRRGRPPISCAHITYVFCARLAARRSWRSLKRLERAARSSHSCLLPPPSAARSPHPLALSPWVLFRPSPLNSKTLSHANQTKSAHPYRVNLTSIRRTAVGRGGLGHPARVWLISAQEWAHMRR